MSTKALKRELFAAIVMLLVAAIALSGSTFAWFANNTVVTAETVNVVARTSRNLAIAPGEVANPNSEDFKTVADINHDVSSTFYAVTVGKLNASGEVTEAIGTKSATGVTSGVAFYTIASGNAVTDPNKYGATTSFAVAYSDANFESYFTKQAENTNYWSQKVTLLYTAADGSAAAPTTAGAVVTVATTRGIDYALHIAVLDGEGNWSNAEVPKGAPTENAEGKFEYKVDFGTSPVVTLDANKPTTIQLFFWYEGEDDDCFSNAALYENAMAISLNFAIAE